MGRCVFFFFTFCIALRPFHWTAAGPQGISIYTTHYIIIRYVCIYRHSLGILPHSAQLRVDKLEEKKPTWICQSFVMLLYSTFFSPLYFKGLIERYGAAENRKKNDRSC